MSVSSTFVGNDFILNDGLKSVVCTPMYKESIKAKISQSMVKAIYKTITSFDVALAMKSNYFSKPARQTYVIDDEEATIDDLATVVLDLNKCARIDSATLFVSSSVGAVEITGDLLLNFIKVAKDAGAEPDVTFGKYTNIKFVIEPPAVTVMEDGIVYVLSVDYKSYKAGTCFMVSEDENHNRIRNEFDPKTGDLTPAAYGDPEDADSYPYTPESMETKTGTIGDAEATTVEVFNSVLAETSTITGSESVNIVNCDGEDTCIKVNIA